MRIAIVGAGIVGCFLAHDLSAYETSVMVFERKGSVCDEVSSANSAIIHAGYDPKDGTLKAKLNRQGALLYPEICKKLHVAYQQCGALVLATTKEEVQTLQVLKQRAIKRGIKVSACDKAQLKEMEPHIADTVLAGLSVPETAIVTPWEIGHALMQDAIVRGVDLHLNEGVTHIQKQAKGYQITTSTGCYQVDMIINAAGLGSEDIMRLCEDTPLFTITPKRGQYLILSKHAKDYAKHVCYPVPSKVGKGILCVPTIHGNQLIGPNNEVIEDMDTSTTKYGLDEVTTNIQKTMKDIPFHEVIHSYSGLRPSGNQGDFYIQPSPKDAHIIHLGCIDSPGLASAPAISAYVIEQFIQPVMQLVVKETLPDTIRTPRFSQLDEAAQAEMIKQQPSYAHVVCRCEKISEQEVVDCIHEVLGAKTIKEIKKRLRPGMGKCQGGYCEIEVAKLLARELKIPLTQVKYDQNTYFMESKVSHDETC